jgi:septal ring factor EnvC (AmiA/AmiB activator)
MNITDFLPYLAGLVALAVFLYARRDATRSEGSTYQQIRDKLDYISDTTRDTREDVRALDRKLDDHSTRIIRIEETVKSHGERLDRGGL